jgi:hypothetical protein
MVYAQWQNREIFTLNAETSLKRRFASCCIWRLLLQNVRTVARRENADDDRGNRSGTRPKVSSLEKRVSSVTIDRRQ